MARSHGKVLAKVWQDDDWTSLPPRSQWLYMLLLSQPKLSLIGCLDYMPGRWTRLAEGVSVDYVECIVEHLEDTDYVIVDRDTDELLIRTFVRHDGIENGNVNLRKGMWGAWKAMQSAVLRKVAVDNMPASLLDDNAPQEAVEMSCSEPMERASERALQRSSEPSSEQAPEPSLDLPPSSTSLHTPAAGRPDERYVVFDAPPPERIPADHVELARQNLAAIQNRRQSA